MKQNEIMAEVVGLCNYCLDEMNKECLGVECGIWRIKALVLQDYNEDERRIAVTCDIINRLPKGLRIDVAEALGLSRGVEN